MHEAANETMPLISAWKRRFVGGLVLALIAFCGHAAQLVVYLDTDNNSATGCTVSLPSPPGGSFAGAEWVLTTNIDTSTKTPTVSSVTRQTCVAAPNTLGAPIVVSTGGWPLGVGQGASGFNVIETFSRPTSRRAMFDSAFSILIPTSLPAMTSC